ncbi:related to glyoxal oxidase precursor [Serendipita indica DSM 11827]|uniref:Related to glyoxal oxidase n=1 Tax=Serendipita indica (strain DSM 11827) TaxID=1109443 RepID=G4TRN4_SERID|nr:related to glyoxal oxidase precursor [Serendipita indica DSM 11827]
MILSVLVLVSTRLDPVVQPGVASSHLHNVVGGNNFNATYDPDFLLASTCTTSPITADKSNYWAPAIYFINHSTTPVTFSRIPSSFNIYYLPRGTTNESGNGGGDVKAFPPGFKMVAGDNGRNTYNASSFENQAISWVCLDYNNPAVNGKETPGFPTTSCPDGIRGQIFFPSCWDGVNLDSPNHKDHVSYPVQNYNSGDCPSSHPVKLVSLFYEQIFSTGGVPLNSDGLTWILANGDTTGYSMHADFQNGWSSSVLQSVIDECHAENSGNGNMRDCRPLKPYIDEEAREACQLNASIPIPDEDVGLFANLPRLLGNNPVWVAGQTKPLNNSYVDTTGWGRVGSLSEGVGSRGTQPVNISSISGVQLHDDDTNASGWEVRGCIQESKHGRALLGAAMTEESQMNLRKCAVLCANRGYSIAGVEFGHECYCDDALRNGVRMELINNVTCGIPCPGNPYENCGGRQALTILAKEGVTIRTTGEVSGALVASASHILLFWLALTTLYVLG